MKDCMVNMKEWVVSQEISIVKTGKLKGHL